MSIRVPKRRVVAPKRRLVPLERITASDGELAYRLRYEPKALIVNGVRRPAMDFFTLQRGVPRRYCARDVLVELGTETSVLVDLDSLLEQARHFIGLEFDEETRGVDTEMAGRLYAFAKDD